MKGVHWKKVGLQSGRRPGWVEGLEQVALFCPHAHQTRKRAQLTLGSKCIFLFKCFSDKGVWNVNDGGSSSGLLSAVFFKATAHLLVLSTGNPNIRLEQEVRFHTLLEQTTGSDQQL